ncbi:hypothetical protein [Nonomuraea sp. LPB2021202275-12-8]|uniref:hypothetical protein n=1 Tax=Nonomuraea sp. LPB2021202275-12-8 TaxID=3120159 RepID=UPI00300CCCEA
MQAAVVTDDTWELAAGGDVTGEIDAIRPGSQFRWLHLTPSVAVADPFSRAVLVSMSATGTDTSSKVEIRAKRAYLSPVDLRRPRLINAATISYHNAWMTMSRSGLVAGLVGAALYWNDFTSGRGASV